MKNPHPCASLTLISYDPSKGYRIDPSALQYLASLPDQDSYSVLSIVGKAKTGKSFLLNQLLSEPGMFPVSNHLGNCSQGIMLATKTLDCHGMRVLVLDCEGFGSLEGSDDRDCKLFMLVLMLSSLVVYNSMGTIDEQTLNNLSMIIEVGKLFEKEIEVENSIPALLWVLRDFSLKMEDKNGVEITAKQYLEHALEEQKGNTQTICHKNRIRRVIKSLFAERNCETLVLPTQQLPNSASYEAMNLREQFQADLDKLRAKLLNVAIRKGCKMIAGQKMTISSFIDALQIYVKSLNRSILQGTMPKIQNITFQLRQTQAKGCTSKFNTFLNQKKKDIIQQLSHLILQSQKIDDIQIIKNKFLQPVQQLYQTTRKNIYQLTGQLHLDELSQIKAQFYQQLEQQCAQIVRRYQQSNNQEQEVDNICEFMSHIADGDQLDQQYANQMRGLKQKYKGRDRATFSNMMTRVEIAYLRRKVQLSKQVYMKLDKVTLELQFTKKQLHRVQNRNKQLESQLISEIKQSRKNFTTPNKQLSSEKHNNSTNKEPGLIRNIASSQRRQQFSNDRFQHSTSKVESSSFYVPYVLIQKPEYLLVRLVKTLFKEDSKRNNGIEFVIDISLLGQKWIANRKFKDFSELHSILVMMFPGLVLPECRAITGPLNNSQVNSQKREIIEQRRKQLQTYLHDLKQIQVIRNSRILQKFLKINKEYTVL